MMKNSHLLPVLFALAISSICAVSASASEEVRFAPMITVSHDTLDFGTVPVGTESSKTLTITNTGDENLIINVFETVPEEFLGNAMTIDSGKGADTLAAGEAVDVVVRIHPASLGLKNTTLSISHNGDGQDTPMLVRLLGEGVGLAGDITISVIPDTLNIGEVIVGSTVRDTVVITNTGTGTLTGTVTPATDFLGNAMTMTDGEGNFTLAAAGQRKIVVELHPASIGNKQSTFVVTHNASNLPSPVVVPVSGRGVAAQGDVSIAVSTDTLKIGEVEVGSNKTETVTITNSGTGTLTGTVTPATDFLSNALTMTEGEGNFTLAAGAIRTLKIQLHPASLGDKKSSFTIAHNATNENSPITVQVTGRGIAATGAVTIQVQPGDTLNFGAVEVGSKMTKTFSIRNTGAGTLTGTVTPASDFADNALTMIAGEGNFTLAADATRTLQVDIEPATIGAKNSSFTIAHNATNVATPITIRVLGEGVSSGEPEIAVDPTSHDFGEVDLSASADLVITLKNTGTGILAGSVHGGPGFPSEGFMVIEGGLNYTLGAGAEKAVRVRFRAPSRGEKEGTLRIFHNAAGVATPILLPLSGTGVGEGPPNNNPVAVDDTLNVQAGVPTTLFVLSNDTDADADTLSITGLPEMPLNGQVSFTATNILYTPNPGFLGNDRLAYSITDGRGGADEALVVIRVMTSTDVEEELPMDETALYQNYPNPFADQTTVVYSLRESGPVRIELLDLLGRTVNVLVDGTGLVGTHSVQLSGARLPNGTYILRMGTGDTTVTRRIAIVR